MRTSSIIIALALALISAGLGIGCSGGAIQPGDGSAAIAPPPPGPGISVSVTPNSASTTTGGAVTFTATVTGTGPGQSNAVTWSVQEAGGGAVDSVGHYTAPLTPGTYDVVATSVADSSKHGTATVTVTAASIAVSVSPQVASVQLSGTVAFSATVNGTTPGQSTAVTWSVREAGGGTIDSSGRYTAPSTAGTYHVVASSVADPTKSDTAIANVSRVIPSDRTTTWNPGLNAVGGIPNRMTIYRTLSPSGGDDTAAIQAAIDNCPANQVVQLGPGDYHFGQYGAVDFRSNVTLRGSVDANGRPTTRFMLANNHQGSVLNFGEGGPDQYYLRQPRDLTIDAAKGATSVTVSSNPGYVVGELVTINQLYAPPAPLGANPYAAYNAPAFIAEHGPMPDPSILITDKFWLVPAAFYGGGAPTARDFMFRTNRLLGQALEITSVTGTGPFVINFSTPLHANYPTSLVSRIWRHSRYYLGDPSSIITSPVKYAGAENIYIEGGAWSGVNFFGVAYCWVKNIEINRWLGCAIGFGRALRNVERDSYVHQAQDPNPGGGGYALCVDWQSADNLIENNIHWAANKVMVMRASGGGNVIGYNYFEDGFISYALTIPEAGLNASHMIGSHMELFEGNQSWNLWGDGVWGNSLWITFYRNHATSIRRNVSGTPYVDSSGVLHANNNFNQDSGGRVMVAIGPQHDFYNFVGNVLGYPGMPAPHAPWIYENTTVAGVEPAIWNLGVDQQFGGSQAQCDQTRARTLRHGNFDYGVNNRVVWDSNTTSHDLPSSLYLISRPDFFGSNPWPWATPENGGLATLPARVRFDAIHP